MINSKKLIWENIRNDKDNSEDKDEECVKKNNK